MKKFLATLAFVLVGCGQALAQTTTGVAEGVGNLPSSSPPRNFTMENDAWWTGFHVGSSSNVELERVDLRFENAINTPADVRVSIWTAQSGNPANLDTLVTNGNLTSSSTIPSNTVGSFTPSGTVTLEANTNYLIAVWSPVAATPRMLFTSDNTQTGMTGWTIRDVGRRCNDHGGNFADRSCEVTSVEHPGGFSIAFDLFVKTPPPGVSITVAQTTLTSEDTIQVTAITTPTTGGDISSWAWTATNGGSFTSTTIPDPTFTAPTVTDVTMSTVNVLVTDASGGTNDADVVFTVNPANMPPTVTVETADTTVAPGTVVNLQATAMDSDGSIVQLQWVVRKPSGSATEPDGTIANATVEDTTWTAPTPSGELVYELRLLATDDDAAESHDSVLITVNPTMAPNTLPTVVINTAARTVDAGATVNLQATVTDGDGTIASYAWTGRGTFANPAAKDTSWTAPSAPTLTAYNLRLTATDNDNGSTAASVTITVRGTGGGGDDDSDDDDGGGNDDEEEGEGDDDPTTVPALPLAGSAILALILTARGLRRGRSRLGAGQNGPCAA